MLKWKRQKDVACNGHLCKSFGFFLHFNSFTSIVKLLTFHSHSFKKVAEFVQYLVSLVHQQAHDDIKKWY